MLRLNAGSSLLRLSSCETYLIPRKLEVDHTTVAGGGLDHDARLSLCMYELSLSMLELMLSLSMLILATCPEHAGCEDSLILK